MRLFLRSHDGLHERGALRRDLRKLTVYAESAAPGRNVGNFLTMVKANSAVRGMRSPTWEAEQGL